VVVTNEVTTLLANLSVTSDKKAAPIVLTGQMTTMTTSNPKATKKDESLMQSMMMEVGTEIEKESELLEFDDFSEVDYDLDYTVQY
jgi:predicted Zn-dependent protease